MYGRNQCNCNENETEDDSGVSVVDFTRFGATRRGESGARGGGLAIGGGTGQRTRCR